MAGKILPLVVNLILFQWIFVVIKLLFQKEFFSIENFMFVILPLSLLTPHIFYQVHTYYPRHIMGLFLYACISNIFKSKIVMIMLYEKILYKLRVYYPLIYKDLQELISNKDNFEI